MNYKSKIDLLKKESSNYISDDNVIDNIQKAINIIEEKYMMTQIMYLLKVRLIM